MVFEATNTRRQPSYLQEPQQTGGNGGLPPLNDHAGVTGTLAAALSPGRGLHARATTVPAATATTDVGPPPASKEATLSPQKIADEIRAHLRTGKRLPAESQLTVAKRADVRLAMFGQPMSTEELSVLFGGPISERLQMKLNSKTSSWFKDALLANKPKSPSHRRVDGNSISSRSRADSPQTLQEPQTSIASTPAATRAGAKGLTAPPTPPDSTASTPITTITSVAADTRPTPSTLPTVPTVPATPGPIDMATPQRLSETPVPVPTIPGSTQSPRTIYKIKRTGKPGTSLLASSSANFLRPGGGLRGASGKEPGKLRGSPRVLPSSSAPNSTDAGDGSAGPGMAEAASNPVELHQASAASAVDAATPSTSIAKLLETGGMQIEGPVLPPAAPPTLLGRKESPVKIRMGIVDAHKRQRGPSFDGLSSGNSSGAERDTKRPKLSAAAEAQIPKGPMPTLNGAGVSSARRPASEKTHPNSRSSTLEKFFNTHFPDDDDLDPDSGSVIDLDSPLGPEAVSVQDREDIEETSDSDSSTTSDAEGDPQYLWHAPSGRSYMKWIGSDGEEDIVLGAFIPDGYKQSSNPSLPWICPIRSCRALFPVLSDMGRHFMTEHALALLNDNLDGTFSVTETSTSKLSGARVISQQAPDPADEETMVEPRLPQTSNSVTAPKRPLLLSGNEESMPDFLSRLSRIRESLETGTATPSNTAEPRLRPTTRGPEKAKRVQMKVSISGREYSKSPFGGSSYGAILPDGYTLSTYEGHPWICPVRSCRRVFSAIANLGAHFIRLHRGCIFNDNGDGTLSKTGSCSQNRPMVMSQNRRLPDELEPLTAPLPAGVSPILPGDDLPTLQEPIPSLPPSMSATPSRSPTPAGPSAPASTAPAEHQRHNKHDDLSEPTGSDSVALWKYITPFLRRTNKTVTPTRAFVPQCLKLPRVRDIHWNKPWIAAKPYMDSQPKDVASLLVQLTGEYTGEPCEPCKKGKGPYDGCVIVGKDAPCELHAVFQCCANCSYHGGQKYCTLKKFLQDRFEALFPGIDYNSLQRFLYSGGLGRSSAVDLRQFQLAHQTSEHNSESTGSSVEMAVEGEVEETSGSRRSERIAVKDSVAAEGTAGRIRNLAGSSDQTVVTELQRQATLLGDSPIISGGTAQFGPGILEMENWEVAPGRIQSEAADNLAFSNAYLTSNQMVPIDHNMSFRVEVVRPGSTIRFDPDTRSTRICSMAAGKLKVQVGNVDFVIGPNGMFRIKPGASFTVENRLYIDAYLHISALHNLT